MRTSKRNKVVGIIEDATISILLLAFVGGIVWLGSWYQQRAINRCIEAGHNKAECIRRS